MKKVGAEVDLWLIYPLRETNKPALSSSSSPQVQAKPALAVNPAERGLGDWIASRPMNFARPPEFQVHEKSSAKIFGDFCRILRLFLGSHRVRHQLLTERILSAARLADSQVGRGFARRPRNCLTRWSHSPRRGVRPANSVRPRAIRRVPVAGVC